MKNKIDMDKVMSQVLAAAEEKRQAAGMMGAYDDGGAGALIAQVAYYQFGQDGKLPPDWEKFVPPPEPALPPHALNFEYCECGCHCHSALSKGIEYSIYNSLNEKENAPYTLFRGHGLFGNKLCKYKTFGEAQEAARKDFDSIP
jgi:hypothetical protein